MSWLPDRPEALADLARLAPHLLLGAWVVRMPGLREEGHEAITRAACAGLDLAPARVDDLVRGVRAPDVAIAGLLRSVLPFAQPRHALRRWSGTPNVRAVEDLRGFLDATHRRALRLPDGRQRWMEFGAFLHALQDSFSPAHVDRDGGRIVRMKHWGPIDPLRRALGSEPADEHGFPSDRRDRALAGGQLTDAAQAARDASSEYLALALRHSADDRRDEARARELTELLDRHVRSRSASGEVGARG